MKRVPEREARSERRRSARELLRLNRTRFSRSEAGYVLLIGLLLVVPESSDLGYAPYALETLVAAGCSLALALLVVALQRLVPLAGAAAAGLLVATFADLYFLRGPVPAVAASLAVAALLLGASREPVLRFSVVAAVVFTVLVCAGRSDRLMTPQAPGWNEDLRARSGGQGADRPAVIHLVLDEFMGARGLRAAAGVAEAEVNALEDLFLANGFKVFENARSTSRLTWISFGDFLSGVGERAQAAAGGEDLQHSRHDLGKNPYFDALLGAGYPIHAVYSEHLHLCPAGQAHGCRSYGFRKRGDLAGRYSPTVADSLGLYLDALRADLSSDRSVRGVALVRWLRNWWHAGSTASMDVKAPSLGHVLVSLEILEKLTGEIRAAGRGQVYFAHLLFPHRPWRLDARCRLRDPAASGRAELYWRQVQCLQSKLEHFLAAVRANPELADAIVVIQGDHGARLDNRDPDPGLRREDRHVLDVYNAFVAVRAEGFAPGVDSRDLSLADVIARIESLVRRGPEAR